MAWLDPFASSVGQVTVVTTQNGPLPPEYFADRIVTKLIHVADTAPEPIRVQAQEYREAMLSIILDGIKRAVASDRAYQTHLMMLERDK